MKVHSFLQLIKIYIICLNNQKLKNLKFFSIIQILNFWKFQEIEIIY